MSSEIQQTFDDIPTDSADTEDEDATKPAWTPGETSPDNECQGCGSHVSSRFVRLFGVDGQVEACLNCTEKNKLPYHAAGREVPHFHGVMGGSI